MSAIFLVCGSLNHVHKLVVMILQMAERKAVWGCAAFCVHEVTMLSAYFCCMLQTGGHLSMYGAARKYVTILSILEFSIVLPLFLYLISSSIVLRTSIV